MRVWVVAQLAAARPLGVLAREQAEHSLPARSIPAQEVMAWVNIRHLDLVLRHGVRRMNPGPIEAPEFAMVRQSLS